MSMSDMSGDRMANYLPYATKEENSTHGIGPAASVSSSRSLGGESKSRLSDVSMSTFLNEGSNSKPGLVDNNNEGNDEEEEGDDDMLPLENDVYAFIAVAPVMSSPFLFALYVILTKYAVCGLLAYGIRFTGIGSAGTEDNIVKFFLIPVAVAMQEDLMHVYASVANMMYDKEVLKITPHATKFKLILSFILRFIDGCWSLYVNFALMIDTAGVLDIMLNFAALHFLQGTSCRVVSFLLLRSSRISIRIHTYTYKCVDVIQNVDVDVYKSKTWYMFVPIILFVDNYLFLFIVCLFRSIMIAILYTTIGIDDVFFGLVEQGFFGDTMEHMSTICKQVSHPRRNVENGTSNGCTTNFDSMLFFVTLAIMFTVYGVYVSGIINFEL